MSRTFWLHDVQKVRLVNPKVFRAPRTTPYMPAVPGADTNSGDRAGRHPR
jgi:hypothetical protein